MEFADPKDKLIAELQEKLAWALARIAELEEKLRQSSQNSSKPPSSDPPQVQRPTRPPSGRKRGGQPGHKGRKRALLPPEKVTRTVPLLPTSCRGCHRPLHGHDPEPLRHQVVELPPITPEVTEYQLGKLFCPCCDLYTRAPLPEGVTTGAFGPRLCAFLGLLSGKYRLSKRSSEELCEEVLGIELSLGSISNVEQQVSAALAAPVEEAKVYAKQQPVVHADETSWKEGPKKAWLWVLWTSLVTVFQITTRRNAESAKRLLGEGFVGILVSDRWIAYRWVALERRQYCWAHLLREFQAMVERGGKAALYGEPLLEQARLFFKWWHQVRDGTLSRAEFIEKMKVVKQEVRRLLRLAAEACPQKTAGFCRSLLEDETALWTFVSVAGVEPTNNAAERALRHAVLWRKGSFGTQSEAGSRFVERVLTTVTTLRQQKRNVLEYLTQACEAALRHQPAPSLLPQPAQSAPSAALAA